MGHKDDGVRVGDREINANGYYISWEKSWFIWKTYKKRLR